MRDNRLWNFAVVPLILAVAYGLTYAVVDYLPQSHFGLAWLVLVVSVISNVLHRDET